MKMKSCFKSGAFIALVLYVGAGSAFASGAGWEPRKACDLLKGFNVRTGSWKPVAQGVDQYFCIARYHHVINFGANGLDDKISYYVTGSEKSAEELKLTLNAWSKSELMKSVEKDPLKELARYAKELAVRATGLRLPFEAEIAIMAGEDGEWVIGDYLYKVKRDPWEGGRGYSMEVKVGSGR